MKGASIFHLSQSPSPATIRRTPDGCLHIPIFPNSISQNHPGDFQGAAIWEKADLLEWFILWGKRPSTSIQSHLHPSVTIRRSSEGCLRKSSIRRRLAPIKEGSKVKKVIICRGEEGVEISYLLHLRKVIHLQRFISSTSFGIPKFIYNSTVVPSLGHRNRRSPTPSASIRHSVAFNLEHSSVNFHTLLFLRHLISDAISFITYSVFISLFYLLLCLIRQCFLHLNVWVNFLALLLLLLMHFIWFNSYNVQFTFKCLSFPLFVMMQGFC